MTLDRSTDVEYRTVPVSWHSEGRLTFFPHDEADLHAIGEALDAAALIHTRVRRALDRHRRAIETLTVAA